VIDDFFENSELQFFLLLILDEFDLSLKKSGLLFIPLK